MHHKSTGYFWAREGQLCVLSLSYYLLLRLTGTVVRAGSEWWRPSRTRLKMGECSTQSSAEKGRARALDKEFSCFKLSESMPTTSES